MGFSCGSAGKEAACNAGDLGLIPGLGRSLGEGKSYPLQYSGLENSMHREAWKARTAQFSSVAQLCPTLCDPMDGSTPGFPVHHQLPELAQTHVRQVSDAIQPSHFPMSLLLMPLIIPRNRVFCNGSFLHIRCPKNWSFSLSISPSNEYLELISLRMDWLDLLAAQGTLKSLFPRHSSKASIHCIQLSL